MKNLQKNIDFWRGVWYNVDKVRDGVVDRLQPKIL